MQVQLDGTGGRLEDGAADDDEGRNDDDCGADDGGRDDEEAAREEDTVTVLDGGAQEEAPALLARPALEPAPPEAALKADEPCAPLESMDSREDDAVVGLLLTSRRRQLHEPHVPSPPHTWTPAPPWGQAQFCVSPAVQSCGPHARVPHTASRIVPPNNKTRRIQHLLTSGV